MSLGTVCAICDFALSEFLLMILHCIIIGSLYTSKLTQVICLFIYFYLVSLLPATLFRLLFSLQLVRVIFGFLVDSPQKCVFLVN